MQTNRFNTDSQLSHRKIALWAGICYLLTFVSIPTAVLYSSVRNKNFVASADSDTAVIIGTILELVVALACIGTAVTLYSLTKKWNEGVALGFIGSRILEASTIFAGIVCLLTVISLRQTGTDSVTTAHALTTMHEVFRLGQNLMPALNALLLGAILYQARLVPRVLPLLGFIGAPLLVAHTIVLMFGITTGSLYIVTAIGVIPIAVWEFSLGIRLTFKGFNPEAATLLLNKKNRW